MHPDVTALCQQLSQLQEAAVAVCKLLVTQENIVESSMGGDTQGSADAQVQAFPVSNSIVLASVCVALKPRGQGTADLWMTG